MVPKWDLFEMRIDGPTFGAQSRRLGANPLDTGQKARRSGGVDQKSGGCLELRPLAPAAQPPARFPFEHLNFCAIVVGNAFPLHLLHEEVVEMLAEPVRLGDLVGRVGSDEQFIAMIGARLKRRAGAVLEIAEAAL